MRWPANGAGQGELVISSESGRRASRSRRDYRIAAKIAIIASLPA